MLAIAVSITRAASESASPAALIFFSLVACLATWLLFFSREAPLPPGVRRPVLVHETSVLDRLKHYTSVDQHLWLRSLVEKYGPAIRFSFPGIGTFVVLCDGPAVRAMLTGQTQLRKARLYNLFDDVMQGTKTTFTFFGLSEVRAVLICFCLCAARLLETVGNG